jgi:large subunit ribosomal protein L28
MSRVCDICGKRPVTGNKVSHAKNHTRRTWRPNLVKVKTEIDGTTGTLEMGIAAFPKYALWVDAFEKSFLH